MAQGSYPIYKTPREGIFRRYYEIGQLGETFHVEVIGEDKCADHYSYLCTLPGVGETLIKVRDSGIPFPKSQIDHVAYFKYGYLLFITFEPAPEAHDIFKRFAKVFEQTYTRFLDLQKAEAQAREAQIEAALERVRSRSMAMHRSDELLQVITIVSEQLQHLGFKFNTVSFAINNLEHDYKFWFAIMGNPTPLYIEVPYINNKMFEGPKDVITKGGNFYADTLAPEENRQWHEHVFAHADFSFLSDETKAYVLSSGYARSVAITRSIMLVVSNYAAKPFTEDQNNIIKRFAVVFEQSYTRFLDLQKAEAQAHEAKIEAALERVRSRSLAMHKSDEVGFVVDELFQRMKELEIGFDSVNILEYTEDAFQIWAAYQPGKYTVTKIPFSKSDIPYVRSVIEAKNSGLKLFTRQYLFEEKNLFLNYLFEETHFKNLPEQRKQFLLQCPCYTVSIAYAKNTAIQLQSYSREAFSENENNILRRFVNVFEQAYTRFLDLQKAEAQAREAQIEAALERVRSRTMAMQRSEELLDVASVLFQQVKALGVPQWICGFCIWEIGDKEFTYYPGSPDDKILPTSSKISLTEKPIFIRLDEARRRGDDLLIYEIGGEEQAEHYRYMLSLRPGLGDLLQSMLDAGFQFPAFQIDHIAYFSYGNLIFITFEHFPEMHDVFKRFAKVFEQTYTRFLDLQQAEAQAREAQIQLALERVRARTMAMQHSDELRDAASVLFQQVKELGIEAWTCGYNIWDEEKKAVMAWLSRGVMHPPFKVPLTENETLKHFNEAAQRGESLFVEEVSGETLIELYRYLGTLLVSQGVSEEVRPPGYVPPTVQVNHVAYFSYGYLLFVTYKPYPEAHDIFKRFAKVFEQTYTRFLDLKKAEEQARESQIEASLERVRSKTMAMHNSQDVGNTVATVFDELVKLGVKTNRCGILIFSTSNDTEVWTARSNPSGEVNLIIGYLDVKLHPMLSNARSGWESKAATFTYELIGDDLVNYYQMLSNNPSYPIRINMDALPSREVHSEFYFPDGAVFAFTSESIAKDDVQIFKRLAGVFGQTYRRYLDLQKAEAQAREAEIEASLERVRASTMAMHQSQQILDVIQILCSQLVQLGFPLHSANIATNFNGKDYNMWIYSLDAPMYPHQVLVPSITDFIPELRDAYLQGKDFATSNLSVEDKNRFYDHLFANTIFKDATPQARKDLVYTTKGYAQSFSLQQNTILSILNMDGIPFTKEQNQILKRFAFAFEQSYVRFLDLKRAEEQAREATIEAALEKVRGKAMAMHSTADLTATVGTLFMELRNLGITPLRLGLGIINSETRIGALYSATISNDGTGSIQLAGSVLLQDHPVLEQIYESWIKRSDYFPVLRGDSLKAYYQKLRAGLQIPDWHADYEHFGQFYPFEEGTLYAWTEKPVVPAETPIFKRFASVLALTYKRYNELQLSEANTREAIRRASIDRVRAEIASMRTTKDLERITPLIWSELTELGVPFIRCGVFIMDEAQEIIHTYLSTPDGKAIGAFHLLYTTPGSISLALASWKKNERYIDHWTEEAFREFADILVKQGALETPDQYLSTIPHGGFYLHFLPFLQGMLYVGNTEQLKDDQMELIQSVADAFSTAYARYEDFNKLEAAKQQVDNTLLDLKKTQNQLVISEKMASLGELTAGIAHEIQNPLNFVNNFSEVSNELLNEMNTEIEKGNFEEVKIITDDIRKNLEKILHHGKRADGIVKGMLQHSRSSSGGKEPTDINALADEYLRLAFHGFRAKDKLFNVATKTDFDKTVGKVNVVPQDIGRVILNLITNAFYTVSEKKKQSASEYEPAVTVRTTRQDGHVLISVTDNGNGISPKVLDKIFQPFFTTKPTGQGTGLGLSLSYDIVKAHGGELKVETKEGEGSEFTISIVG
jgi:signal transduction histidine kinase